jgi:hypothetical protein
MQFFKNHFFSFLITHGDPYRPCPTFLCLALLKRPHGCFRRGPPARRAAVFYSFKHPTLYTYAPIQKSSHQGEAQGRRLEKTQPDLRRHLQEKEEQNMKERKGNRRRIAWGVQGGRRWPQATHSRGGTPLKRL